uniref:Uncharacterized protein n=1 Tax=Triticum urartu TaxID=4572 RepID=A0A8R7K300_TRIUA
MAARSAAASCSAGDADADRLKGSDTSGVTGLSASDGKSSTLGDSSSGSAFLGDAPAAAAMASGAIILRFLRLLRRSYSLKDGFFGRHGPLP